ncbi:MAG: RagB/SusD family nutrient uptake outer membrane protein [Bacteroidota bacterium]
MKKYTYITIFIFSVLLLSRCVDTLDLEPLDNISEAAVWQDPVLIDAYLSNVYFDADLMARTGETNVHNSNSRLSINALMIASMGGEGRSFGGHHHAAQASTRPMDASGVHSSLDYWKYDNIRNANEIIERLGESEFNEDYKTQRIAEARFLRAYMYFQMVIRFGGVPLVTQVATVDSDVDELFVSRNTEQEVYDFIISEMNDLVNILPEQYADGDRGRPTRWAAYAFLSRSALYAASIANYGSVQMDGLLGIPSSEVSTYAQLSYDASQAVINSGFHNLYEGNGTFEENFQDLFLDESANNQEAIWSEVYDFSLSRGHAYASRATPHEFNESWGSMYFNYDHLERFEFISGAPGDSISRFELESNEWTMDELYGNRDPRFHASVFYPETPWKDGLAYFHSGTYRGGELLTSGVAEDGWNYKATDRNAARTGFMIKKRLSKTVQPTGFSVQNDDTDYMVFRLGEIYLNLAEAAFYLDRKGEALAAMNRIRERAGMPPKAEITEANLQNERLVELTMENHSFWDLRRWRIAESELDGKRMAGIQWFYNYDTRRYQIVFVNSESSARIFQSHYYYMPLGVNRTSENPNIVENPGY